MENGENLISIISLLALRRAMIEKKAMEYVKTDLIRKYK